MEKKLKSWQGWLLFGGSMVVVFVLGLCVSALMERRAEVASIFNNRKTLSKGLKHEALVAIIVSKLGAIFGEFYTLKPYAMVRN